MKRSIGGTSGKVKLPGKIYKAPWGETVLIGIFNQHLHAKITIVQKHENATIYLDADSSSLLQKNG